MKPHMMHIARTLAKKEAVQQASDEEASYRKYIDEVKKAIAYGYSMGKIIGELEKEKERIINDEREGDELVQMGVKNAKISCLVSINKIIDVLQNNLCQ